MSSSDPSGTSAVSLQARMAGERGASAVLFDITEDRAAAEQVPRDTGVFEEGVKSPAERQVRTQQPLWALSPHAAAAAPGADLAGGVDLG